jgi:CRISPR-associated protein Cas2
MRYLVTYDVPDDAVRVRVAEAIDDFGVRVQFSVFECELSLAERGQLHARLAALISETPSTSVRMYGICSHCADKVIEIGDRTPPGGDNPWVIL